MSKKSISTSGKPRSSSWRWRSGSTGRSAPDGANRFLLESLTRAALGFIVAYPLWLLTQSSYTAALANSAEALLRWLDRPPWIHALEASDERILIFSFLGGFEKPTAVWDGETMGVFVLAPLLAVIALPGLRSGARWTGSVVALLIGFLSCLSIVGLQTQLIAAEHASSQLGIEIFSPARLQRLGRLNHAIHSIGMLATPSIVWLAGYARVRWFPAEQGAIRWRWSGAVLLSLLLLGWALPASAPPPPLQTLAYHKRWGELVERNPGFVAARVNLGLHLERSGAVSEALAHYAEAERLDPQRFEPHFNRGSLLLRSGRAAEAVASLRAAVELRPDRADAQLNLGLALHSGADRCLAVAHLERAIALDGAAHSGLSAPLTELRRGCRGND